MTSSTDEFELSDTTAQVSAARPAQRRRPTAWPWLATAVVLVLGGVAGAKPIVPPWEVGVIDADLSEAPVEVWRADLGERDNVGPATVVGDTLVMHVGGGAQIGVDVATGEVLWEVEGPGSCHVAEIVTCVRHPAGQAGSEIVTIDAASGEQTSAAGSPRLWSALAVDGELVLLELAVASDESATGIAVTRVDSSGATVWSSSIASDAFGGDEHSWVSLDRLGERVVVSGSVTAILDVDTGEILAMPIAASVQDSTLVTYELPSGASEVHVTLAIDPDRTITRPERMPFISLDETVDADVTIELTHDQLSAVDADGEILWQVAASSSTLVSARLGGVLVVADYADADRRVLAYDLATGELLWEGRDPGRACWGGRTTLLCDLGGADDLVAVDVRTGEVLWTTDSSGAVEIADAGLFMTDGTELVRYAWQ